MPTRSTRSGTLQPPPHTATASTSTATASTSHGHNLFHIRLQALRAGPRQRGAATRTRHGGGSRAAAAAGRNAPSSARHTSPRPCLPGGGGTVPPLPPRASYGCGAVLPPLPPRASYGCGAVLPPLPPSASYGCGAVLGAPQLGSLAPAGWHGWAWVAHRTLRVTLRVALRVTLRVTQEERPYQHRAEAEAGAAHASVQGADPTSSHAQVAGGAGVV